MADSLTGASSAHPQLNLTAEEKRVFKQLFSAADADNLGVVTGEVAVKFFEKTRLEPRVLGEIWQIADTENRGLLTPAGFGIVLRLIGHYQSGKEPTLELAYVPGPLPRFDGLSIPGLPATSLPSPAALQAQSSGGPIRVPPLTPENASEYQLAFERSGARNGILEGEQAKQAFERFKLPNDALGRIWNLADTESRGSLNSTEFVIAMHLLNCYKIGALKQLPTSLPQGLYEAAARRPQQQSMMGRGVPPVPGIPKQFSGSGGRAGSPLTRSPYGPPQGAQAAGNDWAISPADKAQFDSIFSSIDKMNRGYITGDEAVPFFGNSRLPEEILAQIWDLADINSEGHLNRDEFAVAIHLIRQQRALREDARGNLPATLPANLVPPSMRHQIRPPQQPTAPAFDNSAFTPSKPSEDLFGLDAFSSPVQPQPTSSTVGSTGYPRSVDSDMFGNKKTPASPVSSAAPSQTSQPMFKPFVPSSNFGQNMMTSSSTGDSTSSGVAKPRGFYGQQSSAVEDLLGDNDPDVSSRLTSETADLANLSNQVGTLNKQMQEVKTKRASTEQDLSQVNSQKRDFELRLSQLRTRYDQEVKDVKALDSRLNESRAEVRKLQQDCSTLESTLQDLQGQHRQVVGALESDQMENANLKDRIKSVNGDIGQLRTQLDKLRLEARQQKGMVSINKKQLSTTEGERDRVRNEMADLSRDQESSRGQIQSPHDVISPAPSTASQSTNPFFRKTVTSPGEGEMAATSPFAVPPSHASPTAQTQPHPSFDNMFGPSYGSQPTGAPSPFRSDTQSSQNPGISAPSGQSVRSSEGPDVPTPVSSPPSSSYHESPRAAEPPPPPESRQITSSFLPFRSDVQRNDSFSSSIKVAAPASRYGDKDYSGVDTPTNRVSSTTDTERDAPRSDVKKQPGTSHASSGSLDRGITSSPPTSEPKRPTAQDSYPSFSSMSRDPIPGAFPGEPTSPLQTHPTGESTLSDRSKGSSRPSEGFQSSRGDPFSSSREPTRGHSGTREDFDAAFAGFSSSKSSQDRQHSATPTEGSVGASSTGASRFNQEFPPIKENFDADSDSNSEHGFDDNFTTASPHQKHSSLTAQPPGGSSGSRPGTGIQQSSSSTEPAADSFGQQNNRPPFTSATSQLPTPGAQKSPPTYDQVVPESSGAGGSRDPNQFPPEFGNLLPARQDPTTSSTAGDKGFGGAHPQPTGGQTLFGGSTASKGPSSSAPTAFSNSPPLSNTPLSTAPSDAYQSAVSHPSATGGGGGGGGGGGKGPSPATAMASSRAIQAGGSSSFDDDFDREFADLSEAKDADDKADSDFGLSSHIHHHNNEGVDEFNPHFDSPSISKSSTMASDRTATVGGGAAGHGAAEDHFNDFEHNIGGPTVVSAAAHAKNSSAASQAAQQSHDWDAIFSGIDSSSSAQGASSGAATAGVVSGLGKNLPSSVSGGGATTGAASSSSPTATRTGGDVGPTAAASSGAAAAGGKAPLARTVSTTTENDEPNLKELMRMGFSRDASLDALERYDYHLDKAADHLLRNAPSA